MPDLRPDLAEFIGTFFLVLVGCGAIASGASALGLALAFGLVILVLVYALGHVCGAHYNPAITLAFAATGHFPWRRVPGYLAAQVVGAIGGAFAVRMISGAAAGATTLHVGLAQGFLVEALATFLLALVIIAVATDDRVPRAATGLAIGLTVALDAIAFGALTGASMNPARSLGPAIASGAYADLWIYVAAPIVGAVVAMLTYEWLRPASRPARHGEALGALGRVEDLEAPE